MVGTDVNGGINYDRKDGIGVETFSLLGGGAETGKQNKKEK